MDEAEEQAILEMSDEDASISMAALGRFLDEHGLPLLRCIKRVLVGHGITYNLDDMAEEVLQRVSLRLAQRAKDGTLLEVRSLREYVYGAARLCTLNYLRQEGSRPEHPPSSETFWEETDRILVEEGLTPMEMKEVEDAIDDCIEELPGKQKEYARMLATHYDDPPALKDIADLHEVSPESVRNRLYDARSKLEDCLKRKGVEIPWLRQGGSR